MVKKRFQFWGRNKDGKVEKMWSQWFEWDSDNRDPIQLKGYKGDHLLNEYIEDNTKKWNVKLVPKSDR